MSGVDPEEFRLLKEHVELMKRELERKDQIIAALEQRLFGKKSERIDPGQYQLELGEEALGKPEPPPTPSENEGGPEAEEDANAGKARNRRRKNEVLPRNLPVLIEAVLVPEEVEASPGSYEKIGETHHDELEAVRSSLYYRRTVMEIYKRKDDRSRPPVKAPAPEPSIPGTMVGPDLMAAIVTDKYVDHLPHYRQAERFRRRHGAGLRRQTINGWTHAAAELLAPVYRAVKEEVRDTGLLQIDETPGDVLVPGRGETARGYFWYYRNAESGAVCCEWTLSRSHECMLEFLGLSEDSDREPFGGTIQCDGYSAYGALAKRYQNIELASCLAHIRRKLYEARQEAPEVAMPMLKAIATLYRMERTINLSNAPPGCRRLIRRGHGWEILTWLKTELTEQRNRHFPQSKMGEAIRYALGQWAGLEKCFTDGRLELDNNRIENAIRPVKLGLKNYLFIGSAERGKTAALFYTLAANCKRHGIDPEKYFAEVFRRTTSTTTVAEAAALTPARLADCLRETEETVGQQPSVA